MDNGLVKSCLDLIFPPTISTLYEFLISRGFEKKVLLADTQETSYRDLLNNALIGFSTNQRKECPEAGYSLPQADLVLYAVSKLLDEKATSRSINLLTNGYTKEAEGMIPLYPNSSVNILSTGPWIQLKKAVGPDEMYNILMRASVFLPLKDGQSYFQLTGPEVNYINIGRFERNLARNVKSKTLHLSKLSETSIAKYRVCYAKPFLDRYGAVRFHLRDDFMVTRKREALNSDLDDSATKDIKAKELLKRVFGSGPLLTSGRFLDKIPKRLSDRPLTLMRLIINRHNHIHFDRLINTFCPSSESYTPFHQVSAFCKCVIRKLLPYSAFGTSHNWNHIVSCVDSFVKLRRTENLLVVTIFENLKISEIEWLRTKANNSSKMSREDFQKRQRLLVQFIFWLFDCYLVMLIRTHFYVSEPSGSCYNLYYYRHDVWQKQTKLAISQFVDQKMQRVPKLPAFSPASESIDQAQNFELVRFRNSKLTRVPIIKTTLGVSSIKLLPKIGSGSSTFHSSFRVITAMGSKKLQAKDISSYCDIGLKTQKEVSINDRLKHLFHVLTWEYSQPYNGKSDSCLLSVTQFGPRLKSYMSKFNAKLRPKFYVVKVDIEKCFDTIPTDIAFETANKMLAEDCYGLHEIKSINFRNPNSRKVLSETFSQGIDRSFQSGFETILDIAKKGRIYIDKCAGELVCKDAMSNKLDEHLHRSLVRIGRHLYRQKVGIPQGSILSSLLCNMVYDRLERENLFYNRHTSVMFRYVDDFLFISTNKLEAEEFLKTMTKGFEKFGVKIAKEKTLTNFHTTMVRPSQIVTDRMVYLGKEINVNTLDFVSDKPESKSDIAAMYTLGRQIRDPVNTIIKKLRMQIRLRLLQSYIDLRFHSPDTVKQSTVMAARTAGRRIMYTFHRAKLQVRTKPIVSIVGRILEVIEKTVITKNCDMRAEVRLNPREIRQLAIDGFVHAFSRSPKKYKDAIDRLVLVYKV